MSQSRPKGESKLKWLVPVTLLCLTAAAWWAQQGQGVQDGSAKVFVTRSGAETQEQLQNVEDADETAVGELAREKPLDALVTPEIDANIEADAVPERESPLDLAEAVDRVVVEPSGPVDAGPPTASVAVDETVMPRQTDVVVADDTDNPPASDVVDDPLPQQPVAATEAFDVAVNAEDDAGNDDIGSEEVIDEALALVAEHEDATTEQLIDEAMTTLRNESDELSLPLPGSETETEADATALDISGRLFSPSGEPVAGIRIHATPVIELSPAVMWTTQTDARGTYHLSGLQPGRYRIETKSFAYNAVPTVFYAWAGSKSVDITLVASGGAIRNSTGSGYAVSAVDKQGRVIAKPHRIDDRTVAEQVVTQLPRAQMSVDGFAVNGNVISPLLKPVAGAKVELSSVVTQSVHITRTDDDGTFNLQNIAPGDDYRLYITGPNNERFRQNRVRVTKNTAPLEVVLASTGFGQVTGHVIDTRNRPVKGLTLLIFSSNAGARTFQATTDRTGKFVIDQVPAGDVMFVSDSMHGLRARGLKLRPGGNAHAYLVVDKGDHAVTGVVRDRHGAVMRNSDITLRWQTTRDGVTSYFVHNAKTDDQGRYLFTGLGEGPHTLSARAAGEGHAVHVIDVAALNDDFNVDLLP